MIITPNFPKIVFLVPFIAPAYHPIKRPKAFFTELQLEGHCSIEAVCATSME